MMREAVLRRELALLAQECHALRSGHARLVAEADRLGQELAQSQQRLAALYASRSWRLAAPVRVASTLARRMLGRAPMSECALHRVASPAAQPLMLPAPQPAAGAAPSAASDRRREILVVADFPPLYDQQSGGLRLKTLIGMMREAGWRIVFGSFFERAALPGVLSTAEGLSRYEAALREAGIDHFLYGIGEIDAFLKGGSKTLHSAFISFPTVADAVMPLVRSRCPNARILFDMVDFHGLRVAREAALRDDPDLLAEAQQQQALEIACARSADVTLAITDDERAALLDLAPDAVVEVLPNVFELPPAPRPGTEGRSGLLFLGGFWHQPNTDAMIWFVRSIWPRIRRAVPDAVLRIAGSNPGDEVLALGSEPGVEVLGYVPDLAPLFDAARVFVAPLRYGAGMKGKVGQSLSYGLPVVATRIGAEGMGLADGRHLLVADEEEAFAENVLHLMRDDSLWTRLAGEGRAHIERNLSVDVVRQQLSALLDG